MRREPMLVSLGLSLFGVVVLATVALIPVPYPEAEVSRLFLGVFLGTTLGAAALAGLLFTVKFRLGSVRASPDLTLAYLAHGLRMGQSRVTEEPGQLKVALGSSAAVTIVARPFGEETVIAYHADATTSGWGTVLTLLILLYPSVAAIPVTLYLFVKAWRFARTRVAGLLPADGVLPAPATVDDVRAALVRGLAEAHRHAAEAYETRREGYRDSQGIVLLGALFVWFALFLGFATLLPEPDWSRRIVTAFLYSSAVAVVLAVAAVWAVRRWLRPGLDEHRAWAERLHAAWGREAASATLGTEGASSFEILAEASRQVPAWLDVTRRAGIRRDPGAFLLLVLMAWWASEFLILGTQFAVFDIGLAALLVGGGTGLTLGGLALYLRWHSRRDREIAQARREWERQLTAIRARMEEFLQDL